jgi:hypothetical protein
MYVVNPLSEAAMRVLSEVTSGGDGPQRLYGAWHVEDITDADLRDLLPLIWTRNGDDRPEQAIGAAAWVTMFRAAGPLVVPTNLPTPAYPLTLYRGAPEQHRCGMAWTPKADVAGHFRDRCGRFGKTAYIYRTTVEASTVLAVFHIRPPELEIIVDPRSLGGVERYDWPSR